jgi:hypothetical protein
MIGILVVIGCGGGDAEGAEQGDLLIKAHGVPQFGPRLRLGNLLLSHPNVTAGTHGGSKAA